MDILKSTYRLILRKLPDKIADYIIYFKGYKKILNLKNPQYYGEKIQWLKLYGHLEELKDYVDKYEVRSYVERTIGNKYLNELYGVYDNPEDIDYTILPDKFVLKCTNGSGQIIICKDKKEFKIEKANRIMYKWLRDNFYKMKKETQYRDIKNRIIAEQYLEDETGALRDYKFFCYDGIPLYYGVFTDRYTDETVDMYDIEGNKLIGVLNGGVKNSNTIIKQGENFQEMLWVVKRLAEPFQFVRVDLYQIEKKIIFGELTFTGGAGSEPFTPLEFDKEIAKRIKLGRVLK